MPDQAHAIAAALHRVAEAVREYEQANLPRERDDRLSTWRAGRRSAALEIGAWIEARASEYEAKGENG